MLIYILATAVVLGVLIFVHELGHFVAAKLVDIEVPRFSIGFGPKVLGFRRGETEYVLSALPLGGYVKMAGMEDLETIEGGDDNDKTQEKRSSRDAPRPIRPRDFEAKSLPARTMVISAGVLMNLLFAFLAFAGIALGRGVPEVPAPIIGGVVEERLPEGAAALAAVPRGTRITAVGNREISDLDDLRIALSTMRPGRTTIAFDNAPPIQIQVPSNDSLRMSLVAAIEPIMQVEPMVQEVIAGGAAAQAGLRPGDRVMRVAGVPVESWQELVAVVEAHPGQPISFQIERDGAVVSLAVTPESNTVAGVRTFGRIGARAATTNLALPRARVGLLGALAYGAQQTAHWVKLTVEFIVGIFQGEQSARSVGGVITIAQISGEAARAGLETLINFMALLSVNLAVLNLLPIPVLDGGQLLFLAVEAVRGRALSLRQRMRLSQVGLVIILALIVFANGNDLLRVFGF